MPAGLQRGSLLNCTLPAAACDALPDGSHGAMPPGQRRRLLVAVVTGTPLPGSADGALEPSGGARLGGSTKTRPASWGAPDLQVRLADSNAQSRQAGRRCCRVSNSWHSKGAPIL